MLLLAAGCACGRDRPVVALQDYSAAQVRTSREPDCWVVSRGYENEGITPTDEVIRTGVNMPDGSRRDEVEAVHLEPEATAKSSREFDNTGVIEGRVQHISAVGGR